MAVLLESDIPRLCYDAGGVRLHRDTELYQFRDCPVVSISSVLCYALHPFPFFLR